DHAAILGDRLADRLEALRLGGIEKAARVDQHDVGAGIVGGHGIAFGAEPGQDTLGIDEVLRTAERNHADPRRGGKFEFHGSAPDSPSRCGFLAGARPPVCGLYTTGKIFPNDAVTTRSKRDALVPTFAPLEEIAGPFLDATDRAGRNK